MAQRLSHPEREGQVKGQFRHAPQKQTRSRRSCASTIQALALLLPGHGKCRSWLQASSPLVFCLQASPDSPNFSPPKEIREGWEQTWEKGQDDCSEPPPPWLWRTQRWRSVSRTSGTSSRSTRNSLTSTYQSTFLSPSSYHLTIIN